MPRASIMTEKLARRGLRIHQDYETDVLGQVTVAETMDRDIPQVPPQCALTNSPSALRNMIRNSPATKAWSSLTSKAT